jgi:hypothetical protein
MKGMEMMMKEVLKGVDVPSMLKNMGIDLVKLQSDLESWRLFVIKTLSDIDAKLLAIETKTDQILQAQQLTNDLLKTAIQSSGSESNDSESASQLLPLLQELVAWKRQQMYQQLNPPAQPLVARPVPNNLHTLQPTNQPMQP